MVKIITNLGIPKPKNNSHSLLLAKPKKGQRDTFEDDFTVWDTDLSDYQFFKTHSVERS